MSNGLGFANLSSPPLSRAAIVRTYLKNRARPITRDSIVIRPLLDNAPDMAEAKKWVEAHPLELRPLAQVLLDHIHYVNQDEFEIAFEESLGKLKAELGERP